jgi:HEPN domain-containing protein
MRNKANEWVKQSDYDLDTAKYMYTGGRYTYTVFMCHLSVEKILKGLYYQKIGKLPPKTHNLIYLIKETGLKPDNSISKHISILNEANISARYPESLEILQKIYTKDRTSDILRYSEEVISWIKKQY